MSDDRTARTEAIEAMTDRFIDKWLTLDRYDDEDIAMVREQMTDVVDALSGGLCARLADDKGGLREVFVVAEDIGYTTVQWMDGSPAPLDDAPLYRIVDPS
jgi:hypothetical protein